MMRRATLLIVVALLLFGGLGTIVIRRGAAPIYQLTFNASAPYGTDEDSDGTADCATHGATATVAARFDCECLTCDEQEVDGALQHDAGGAGITQTKWCDVFSGTPQTEVWIRFWIYIDDDVGFLGNSILEVTHSAGCAQIGADVGYTVNLNQAVTNQLFVSCDGSSTFGNYPQDTWEEFLIRVNIVDGDIDLWKGSPFSDPPHISCNGTGGDGATPITGFLVEGVNTGTEFRWDDIRVYNADPR